MSENTCRKMFTLSFDDGTVQDRRLIALLGKYGLPCTFNLNSGLFGQKHTIVHEGISVCHDEIEADEVRALYRDHEVAVHTVHHPNLLKCSGEQIVREVLDDHRALTELSGKEIIGMAYPGGPYYNDFVIETILANTPVRYARTTNAHRTFALPEDFMRWHPTCHQNDPALMELARAFLSAEPERDMLFYVWGHSFEFDKFQSWESFEGFLSLIAGRPDIGYMTNGQVYGCAAARRAGA